MNFIHKGLIYKAFDTESFICSYKVSSSLSLVRMMTGIICSEAASFTFSSVTVRQSVICALSREQCVKLFGPEQRDQRGHGHRGSRNGIWYDDGNALKKCDLRDLGVVRGRRVAVNSGGWTFPGTISSAEVNGVVKRIPEWRAAGSVDSWYYWSGMVTTLLKYHIGFGNSAAGSAFRPGVYLSHSQMRQAWDELAFPGRLLDSCFFRRGESSRGVIYVVHRVGMDMSWGDDWMTGWDADLKERWQLARDPDTSSC